MSLFHDMKIRAKLTLGFGVISVLFISSLIYVFSMLNSSREMGETLYANYGAVEGEIGLAYADFQLLKVDLRNALYLYEGDASKQSDAVRALEEAEAEMEKYFDSAREKLLDEENQDLLDGAITHIEEYLSDAHSCIDLMNSGKLQEAREYLLANGVESANNAQTKILELIESLDSMAADQLSGMEKELRTNLLIILITIIFDTLAACIISFVITKEIRKPLAEITKVSGMLAEGDLSQDVKYESKNELGQLAESFREMTVNIRKQAEALKSVAEGNLSIDITPQSEKDVMGNAIASLVRDNNRVFNMMKESSIQVSTGAQEVAAASQALAQGSTEQAGAIEQITASISDIAERIKQSASEADEANRLVSDARDEAEGGNHQMAEMIEAMQQINEASENISKIIKVIDDIAFQTNILALNAAVEAARAGNQGKGFAVVADEVRSLAGKSAQAASETAELIEDSITKVSRGSKLAEETAAALKNIMSAVEQSVALVENIAKASGEQATAVTQIDQGLTQVSQVVQTNSATSQQCASASEELSNQAVQLREELAAFQLKDDSGNYGYYLGADQRREAPRYSAGIPENNSNERIISLDDGYGKY